MKFLKVKTLLYSELLNFANLSSSTIVDTLWLDMLATVSREPIEMRFNQSKPGPDCHNRVFALALCSVCILSWKQDAASIELPLSTGHTIFEVRENSTKVVIVLF